MQMETNFAYIDENYKRIVDAMEEAKAKYRKPSDDITLMAVTKTAAAFIPWEKTGCRNTCPKRISIPRMQRYTLSDTCRPIK